MGAFNLSKKNEAYVVYNRLWNLKRFSLCQYVGPDGIRCEGKAIKSHTIQRRGTLSSIAEEGHVLRIGTQRNGSERASRQFIKEGNKRASVFDGFCEKHDRELFNSIETLEAPITGFEALLLGYRCICHEAYKKEKVASIYGDPVFLKAVRENGQSALDRASAHLAGTRLALRDLVRQKAVYEQSIHLEDTTNLHYVIFELERPTPFAFATSFAPEFSLMGDFLLPPNTSEWSSVTCFCGYMKGTNIVGFVGIQELDGHDVGKFISSLGNIPLNRLGSIAFHTAIEHSENTFFKPSWIDQLLPEIRDEVLKRFGSGVPGEPNSRKANLAGQFDIVNVTASGCRLISPS